MRRIICSAIVAINLLVSLFSQDPANPVAKDAFQGGEKLKYVLRYGLIVGGEALLTIKDVKYDKQIVYHAKATAKTTGIADKIFHVVDIYESYFDKTTNQTYKAVRNIKEGSYKFYNEVTYNRKDSTVYSMKSDTIVKVPPGILDMIATIYYIRRIDYTKLKIDDRVDVVTYFDDEIFPFPIRYKGTETINTKIGKVKCHRFDPVVEVGRIFESEDDMTIWYTADKNCLPVRVSFNMLVGSVKCDLVDYSNLKYPLMTE